MRLAASRATIVPSVASNGFRQKLGPSGASRREAERLIMRSRGWLALAVMAASGMAFVGSAGATGTIPVSNQLMYCKGLQVFPSAGELVLTDESCVVNFFIGNGGTWTSAYLESSNDGGQTWSNRGSYTFPYSTTGAGVSTVAETGGTSGIVVDNVGNTTTFQQASSLYFSNLSNTTCSGVAGGACAIKLTQSGLQ